MLRDASFTALIPVRGESKRGIRIAGSENDGPVNLWAQLDHPQGGPVNLHPYAGIAFWAQILVAINDRPFEAENSSSPWLTREVLLDEKWQRIVLLFEDFEQSGTAEMPARSLDRGSIVSINFIAGKGGESFALWIDDLALLCRGACK